MLIWIDNMLLLPLAPFKPTMPTYLFTNRNPRPTILPHHLCFPHPNLLDLHFGPIPPPLHILLDPKLHGFPPPPYQITTPPRPKCQICFKVGHTTNACYHRTDLHYHPPPPPQRHYNAYKSQQTTPLHFLPSTAATSNIVNDPNWYMDSGASHHFTPNLNLLEAAQPFHGGAQIQVGNGQPPNPPQRST
ncbi:extensin-3-like isoform X2 [Humulus lupulus]|uniref:extensin-3-like isoform X2 n=1 Tax=Humulus lupulus TaxID=3486 RepID=UPI002B401973|nr:extensin-3-like isoform X2 [Humulus lupulus]